MKNILNFKPLLFLIALTSSTVSWAGENNAYLIELTGIQATNTGDVGKWGEVQPYITF